MAEQSLSGAQCPDDQFESRSSADQSARRCEICGPAAASQLDTVAMAARSAMAEHLSPETSISHYRIMRKLGAGGMGEVYLAEDTKLDRKVAIKFLSPESTADEQAKKRLVREARAAAK